MNTETNELIFSQAVLLFTALEEANISNTASWVKHLEEKFQDYPDDPLKPDNVKHQQVLINRALRLMLNNVPNSFEARLALIDCHVNETHWIAGIKKFVIPFMVEHKLFD